MSPRTEAKKQNRFLLFIGLSILAHLLLLLCVHEIGMQREFKIPENTVYVDLDKAPPPMSPAEQEKARQIVESEMADATPPKDAKYLGERDQNVKEETKAKQVDSFRKGGAPSHAGSGGKHSLALKDLMPPSSQPIKPPTQADIDGFREKAKQQQQAKREASNGGEAPQENLGAADNDYLKDVKEGDRTLLSTKEFVYFGYYRRIRQKLEVAWNAKLRSSVDAYAVGGRRLAADHSYVTGLVVTLDRYGKITSVRVLQKSGAHDLDSAAVDAFNDAGPFPNPPAGLVDASGHIEIRWDFILQS